MEKEKEKKRRKEEEEEEEEEETDKEKEEEERSMCCMPGPTEPLMADPSTGYWAQYRLTPGLMWNFKTNVDPLMPTSYV